MSMHGTNMFRLGQKGTTTELPKFYGAKHFFVDLDYPTNSNDLTLQSALLVEAVWVQNKSGGALSKSTVVAWASGGVGTQAGAVTSGVASAAGVVDPYLTATVAADEGFWLIVGGPVLFLASAAISANAILVPTADGKVVTQTVDAAGVNARCGRLITAATADGQYRRGIADFRI